MYTIKRAAEQVGLSASTLRAWEVRYGVGTSRRTEAGYRIYDDRSLRALRLMRQLVDEGWSVRAAAEETLRRTATPAPPAAPDPREAASPTDELVRAAADYDQARLDALLDRQFSTASFETVVDGWLLPALRELGTAWETGRVSVSGEHLAANAVARRLSAAYDAAGDAGGSAPRVVLGLPPGARHDLGLLCFATAVRRAGLATTYLGADVPVDDWATAMTAQQPDCIVLAVPMADDAEATAHTVAAIESAAPSVLVAIGGSAQDLAPDRCLRLGHRIGAAATLLAHALERRRHRD